MMVGVCSMASNYYNRSRNERRKNGSSIWKWFLLFMLMPGAFELLDGIINMGESIILLLATIIGVLAAVVIPVGLVAGFISLLMKLFRGSGKKTQKKARSATSITASTLLKDLQEYFTSHEKLDIDKDTYVICTSQAAETKLYDYDIIMNDEYVSDLQLFANSFPSGFNSFATMVDDMLKADKKKVRKKKKETAAPVVQETTREAEKKVEETSNCTYYIRTLESLNRDITNEQITSGLNDTVRYLHSIDAIEKEFPECKSKTTKLYQYYLPMLTDILKNYNRLNQTANMTDDFKANEDRLIKTIVLINGALKTISQSLTEDYNTDMKVDMKTLESVLKKDGLIDDMKESTSN